MFDTTNCDREMAFVIYKGKEYRHYNHQYCIQQAIYEEKNIIVFDGMDDDDRDDSEAIYKMACDTTHQMFEKDEDIHGFDLWDTDDGYVLSSHFEDSIYACKDWISKIKKEFNIVKIGYFFDWTGDDSSKIKIVNCLE